MTEMAAVQVANFRAASISKPSANAVASPPLKASPAPVVSTALTEMADLLGIPLFGILPQTDLYNTHTVREKNFLTAIENMTGRLMGEAVPLLRGISIEGMRRKRFFTRISE